MNKTSEYLLRVFLVLLLLIVFRARVNASSTWVNPSQGDWFVDSNWTGGVPDANRTDYVFIDNGGTASINGAANPEAVGAALSVGYEYGDGALSVYGKSGSHDDLALLLLNVGDAIGGKAVSGTVIISSGGSAGPGDVYGGAPQLAIGSRSGGTGAVTVIDAGSRLLVGQVDIGSQTGSGTLNVQNGGTVISQSSEQSFGTESAMFVADTAGSTGSVNVSGAAATFDISSQFNPPFSMEIGSGGVGSLAISAGGKVTSSGDYGASIATTSGSTGSVILSGSNSSWTESGGIYVGGGVDYNNTGNAVNGGNGTLRIQSGGLLQASGLRFLSNGGGEVTVDNGSTSTPGLLLVGGDAIASGGTLGDIVIGKTTAARAELRTGGMLFNNRAYIGIVSGGNGSVLVTDPGSEWGNTGSIWVGNQGDGSLEVRNGGLVISSGNGYIGYTSNTTGNVTVSGANSKWVVSNIYVGGTTQAAGGTGTLQLDTGGAATASTATVYNTGYLNLGANPVLNGALTILGGAIQFVDSSNTVFSNNITLGAGGVNVYTYGHPSTLSGNITGEGGLVKGGSNNAGLSSLTLTGSSNYTGVTTINAGTLFVNGSITSAVTVNSGATLGGNGAVGSLTINSNGILAPGNSPGTLTVNGNYTQNSGGILNIEVGGASPGVNGYDQVAVTGTSTLNGTLNLTLVNGFRPKVGDTFNIVTSSGTSGNFSTVNSSGFTATSNPSGSGIQLTVMTVQPGIPVINSATSASGTQDQPFSYQITATDSPTSYDASGLPAGLGVDTSSGLISGTPGTSGSFNVTISATNSAGTGSATLTLNISAPIPTPTPTPPAVTPTPTPTPAPPPATVLGNISTRLAVQTGDNVLIGGFIVTGTQPKNVLIRAIGPSINIPGALANPKLDLYSGQTLLESNDNWVDSPNKQAIIDTTIPPSSDLESAIIRTLPANNSAYTAVVSGADGGTGIGLVEVYDLDQSVDSKLANISTRGFVQTADNVMIGGFIVLGQASQNVLIRAIGPSLPVEGALADPYLELHDGNGALVEANDNWVDSPEKQAVIDTAIPPSNNLESAILRTLAPGNYTAILRGNNSSTGIGLVEVYALE